MTEDEKPAIETEPVGDTCKKGPCWGFFVIGLVMLALIMVGYILFRPNDGDVRLPLQGQDMAANSLDMLAVPPESSAKTVRDIEPGPLSTPASMPVTEAKKEDVLAFQDRLKTLEARTEAAERHSVFGMICGVKALAEQGRPFERELSFLRRATVAYAVLQEELVALEPAARDGVKSVQELRDEARRLAGAVNASVDKSQATDWVSRVWAEIRNFISIRRIGGSPVSGTMDAVLSALDRGDLPSALDEAEALPPSAKDVLKRWRGSLETRIAMDKAFARLFDQLENGLKEE